ncbi:restriction endonuclease [Streptomyces sp. NPDC046900]|uniref:restriction endonuclease n=1 Tax=Streptomyces sp. NPDC046900 TaxID=3155473 RepID=UPI0033D7A527
MREAATNICNRPPQEADRYTVHVVARRRARSAQNIARDQAFWRQYELRVKELLEALGDSASVAHNKHIVGRISGIPRQVDVLLNGDMAKQPIRVAVEVKYKTRPIDIEVIDGFVGKLLDMGVERGVIYSKSGFTDGAVGRAMNQANPGIGLEYFDPVFVMDDTMSYLLVSTGTAQPRRSRVRVPSLTGPVVGTYDEFLQGDGFLFRNMGAA